MAPEIASYKNISLNSFSNTLYKLQSYNSLFGQNYVNFNILMHKKRVLYQNFEKIPPTPSPLVSNTSLNKKNSPTYKHNKKVNPPYSKWCNFLTLIDYILCENENNLSSHAWVSTH